GSECRWRAAREDYRDLPPYQVRSHSGHLTVVFSEPIFDRDVLALDKSGFAEALLEQATFARFPLLRRRQFYGAELSGDGRYRAARVVPNKPSRQLVLPRVRAGRDVNRDQDGCV